MRNLVLSASIILAIALASCAQKKEVPSAVKTAFEKQFKNASAIKWDQEKTGEWEAEFKMSGKEYSAKFDESGKWLETEYEISENQIPASVKNLLNTTFVGYKIKEAEFAEMPDSKAYEFELVKGNEKIDVAITEDGKILKQSKQDENIEEQGDNEEKD